MNQVNLALQIIPMVESVKVFAIVDKAIECIQKSGFNYIVTPFETVLEGNLDQLFDLVKEVQSVCYQVGTEELIINIKIHSAKNKDLRIDDKMAGYL